MCHYITIVAGGVSETDLDAFMRARGRRAMLLFNASVQRELRPDELHFLTTKGHCDCGTALAYSDIEERNQPEQAVAKLKAKGWSLAKIDRWLAAKQKAASKAPRVEPIDSVAFWATLARDLKQELSPTSIGLLLHFYSDGIGEEKFPVRRVEPERENTVESVLESMCEDELTILPMAA